MLLLNKLFSYNESVLSHFPRVLSILNQPLSVKELYLRVMPIISDPIEFIQLLDCLYALGKIDFNETGDLYLC